MTAFDSVELKPGEAKSVVFAVGFEESKYWSEAVNVWKLPQSHVTFVCGFISLNHGSTDRGRGALAASEKNFLLHYDATRASRPHKTTRSNEQHGATK